MTTITEWIENYIDPNQIFFAKSSGGGLGDRKTFVFAEGRLHLGNWNKTHKEMISASPALQARINDLLVDASNPLGLSTGTIAKLMAMSPTLKKQNLSLVYRANATPLDLMGRFGKHKVIKWFWEVVKTFTDDERVRLLQFVTGCGGLPAQGFKALQSNDGHFRKFNIQSILKVVSELFNSLLSM
jgi:hypothetical protein